MIQTFATDVIGMDHQTQSLTNELVREWMVRRPRNVLRRQYMDSKQITRKLGISIPPRLMELDFAVGLPETAVEALASRCIWDGIVTPSNSDDPFELAEVLDDNRFDIEIPQAFRSAMAQSLAPISTTLGDVSAGEPLVKVMAHSALWSAALWDKVRRQLRGFLSINKVDDFGTPVELTVFTPTHIVHARTSGAGWFVDDARAHGLNRVPVEPMPYAPDLDRPLGRARINRRVMSLTDRAVNAILRLEVHAELFSAPKFMLLGASRAAFTDENGQPIPLWNWYMTRLNVLEKGGEDEDVPTLEQIEQQSPQPHVELLRAIYAQFSGETKVPLNSLGIVQDNPPSAEGLYAMKEDLVILASNANRVWTYGLNRVMQNIVMLRDGLDAPTRELRQLSQRFRNPAMPSVVSQSDAIVKQISAIPDLAASDVVLEELGYTDEQITRIRADIRRSKLEAGLTTLADRFKPPTPTEPAPALTGD